MDIYKRLPLKALISLAYTSREEHKKAGMGTLQGNALQNYLSYRISENSSEINDYMQIKREKARSIFRSALLTLNEKNPFPLEYSKDGTLLELIFQKRAQKPGGMSVEEFRPFAQHPYTPFSVLKNIYEGTEDISLRCDILRNPNCDHRALERVVNSEPLGTQYRGAVAANINIGANAVRKLYSDEMPHINNPGSAEVIKAIAGNRASPRDLLTNLAYQQTAPGANLNDGITGALLGNPILPPTILENISNDPRLGPISLTALAQNPNSTAITLLNVAQHVNTPPEATDALLKHKEIDDNSLRAILKRPNISPEHYKMALRHPNAEVGTLSQGAELPQSEPDDLLYICSNDKASVQTLHAVAKNPNATSEALDKAARHPVTNQRQSDALRQMYSKIVSHPNVRAETLLHIQARPRLPEDIQMALRRRLNQTTRKRSLDPRRQAGSSGDPNKKARIETPPPGKGR